MRVLLIDDEEDHRRVVAVLLAHGLEASSIVEVDSAAGYAEELGNGPYDVAVASNATAWGDGASLLAAVRRRQPGCATILLGNLAPDIMGAVLASGAVDAVLARSGRGLARLVDTVREVAGAPREPQPGENVSHAVASPADEEHPRAVMAALCHDLQDPLQVILHTARRIVPGDESAPSAREMQRIVGNAERMQAMLDALAQGADLGARAPNMESVELDALLEQVLHDLEARGATQGTEVHHTPLPMVTGDREQLHRLLENLLGNALKFRGAQPVRAAVQAIERPHEWLLCFIDNGIGIAPEDAERVFSMFVRLHGPHDYPGSGVGLATCRRITRAHGGDIWVQPTPGGGATFIVAIPKRQAHDAEALSR